MPNQQRQNPNFVEFIRPDGMVEMRHVDYDTMLVHPENVGEPAPIPEEERQAYYATQYQRDREREYPPVTDYIDGVVKGDQAQIDAYIAACQAVKAKYPKPA
jgi:hypothetical protein